MKSIAFSRFVAVAMLAAAATASALAAQAPARPVVVIDPGHGGAEPGVVAGDLVEKDLVLRIGFAIAAEFVKHGYDVRLTRTGDYAVDWNERRRFAEEAGASLLLMLHLNQDTTGVEHGAVLYAHLDDAASSRAADAMAAALRRAGSAAVIEARPLPFLQSTTVPTVMVELAFLTHPVERRLAQMESFHQQLGRALVDGASTFGLRAARP